MQPSTGKIFINLHLITALLGWIFFVVMAGMVVKEGGLAALGSLCLLGTVTGITLVDILSVYSLRAGKALFLPVISTVFWSAVVAIYGFTMLTPNQPWQSRILFGVIVVTALFKIKAAGIVYKSIKAKQNIGATKT